MKRNNVIAMKTKQHLQDNILTHQRSRYSKDDFWVGVRDRAKLLETIKESEQRHPTTHKIFNGMTDTQIRGLTPEVAGRTYYQLKVLKAQGKLSESKGFYKLKRG